MNFNQPKIDSFTVLLPFKTVKIESHTFTAKYEKLYLDSGVVIDNENSKEFYENYCQTSNDQKKCFLKYKRIKLTTSFGNNNLAPVKDDFIQIMITSKLALNNYFTGIDNITIHDVLKYINEDGIISLTLDQLLDAKVTDIDICKDFQANTQTFKDLKAFMLEYILDSKRNVIDSKSANVKESFGILYNQRHKATPTKPFMKLYNKTMELVSSDKKRSFKEANLSHMEEIISNGIARIEVTIKNNRHKTKLGIDHVKNLRDLISLDQLELNRIYSEIISQYYNPVTKKKELNTLKMTPMDSIIANLIKYIIKQNKEITTHELIQIAMNEVQDNQDRYRIKLKCLEIIEKLGVNKSLKNNDFKKQEAIEIMQNLNIFLPD